MKNNNVAIFFGIVLIVIVFLLGIVINDINGIKVVVMPGDNVFIIQGDRLVKYNKKITKKTKIKVLNDDRKLSFTYINDKVNFYEGKKEVEVKDDFKYAYTKGVNIKEFSFDTSELSYDDINVLNTILKNHNIDGYDNLTTSKITYNNKTLYFATNLFEEYTYDKVFAFVYYFNEDSDIIYLVEKVESTDNIYDACMPNLNSVMKINSSTNIVINCNYYSEIGSDIYFYDIKNGNIRNN